MKMNRLIVSMLAVAGMAMGALAQESKPEEGKPQDPKAAPINLPSTPTNPTPAKLTAGAPQPMQMPFSTQATWSDPEIEKVGKLLEGAWRTTRPVGQGDDKLKSADVFLAVAHVGVNGLPDALYVEAARVDAPWAPFRQALWQIYKKQGKVHIRTIEFRQPKAAHPFLVSLWAAPDRFPAELDLAETYGTLDLEVTLDASGKGLTGKTPYPYPTNRQGAIEMTSEMKLEGDTLTTSDRGFDATGKIVWGSAEGQGYQFKRFTPDVQVEKLEDGLTKIVYGGTAEGDVLVKDSRVGLHTIGSLLSGYTFENSRQRNQLVAIRVGQEMLPGFMKGTAELRSGERFKLLIPASMAYGTAGNQRYKVPADAWLSYDIEVVNAEPPPPAPEAAGPMPETKPAPSDAKPAPKPEPQPNRAKVSPPTQPPQPMQPAPAPTPADKKPAPK